MTGIEYPDTLEELPMQIFKGQRLNAMLFPHTGAPPHFHTTIWIGSKDSTQTDCHRQPYHLATSFTWLYNTSFFSGYIKGALYIPPFLTTLPELLGRYDIMQLVKPSMITNVWIELEYPHNVSRATQGAVNEHLQIVKWNSYNLIT